MSISNLIDSLKKGVVTIVFEKIETKEIRSMPCTLNKEIANIKNTVANRSPKCSTIVMWALDKKAWRDVRVDTIIEWYEGKVKV